MTDRHPPGARPAAAFAVALSLLPGIGPAGLGALLSGGDPEAAWADVLAGRRRRPPTRSRTEVARTEWDAAARSMDVAGVWRRTCAAGIGVTWVGRPDYPVALVSDPLPPAVLFWQGALEALAQPCVALVGTRHATPEGRALAWEMGRDLAAAGVCVVSGLALGIDGASHRGALSTGRAGATVGVAASGVDRVYPARHRELWRDVGRLGAVISETPPGRPAQTWRFPARNRIIAGLVSIVVIVESHAAGGSLITADAAIERGIEVRAVPGPVRSPASAGTNQLLYDGPGPVRDASDILVALGTRAQGPGVPGGRGPGGGPPGGGAGARRGDVGSGGAPAIAVPVVAPGPTALGPTTPGPTALAPTALAPTGSAPARSGSAQAVLDTMGWQPRSLNWLIGHTGLDVAKVAAELASLAQSGWVAEERGWWQRLA